MQQAVSRTSIPTLPAALSLCAKGHDRRALLAALTFVDRPPRSAALLASWFEKHLVAPGRMGRPSFVTEGFSEPVALASGGDEPGEGEGALLLADGAPAPEEHGALPEIVDAARYRVLASLRAFVPPASDDRFLAEAVDQRRVRSGGDPAVWEACPGESDWLSDIVLSLFAADILSYRAFHDAYLCVCKTCLRIDFDPERSGRTGCPDHQPTVALGAVRRSRPPL